MVSTQLFSRAEAQISSVRGDQAISLVVVQGAPPVAYLPSSSLNVGVVVRTPTNLKAGCLAGPTLLTRGGSAAAGYTGTSSSDTTLTRSLMHVDPDDASSELPSFPAEAAFFMVPAAGGSPLESQPFAWTVQPNFYRPLQPAADVVGTYPSATSVAALLTPYATSATSGTVVLPANSVSVLATAALSAQLNFTVPAAAGYNPGQVLTIRVANPNGQSVGVLPTAGDYVGTSNSTVTPVAVIAAGAGVYAEARLISDGATTWKVLLAAGALPTSLTGLVYANGASAPTAANGYQVATAFSGLGINPSSIGGTGALTGLTLNGCYVSWPTVTTATQGLNWFRSAMWGARLSVDATTGDLVFISTTGSPVERFRVGNASGDVIVGGALTSQNLTLGITTGTGVSTVTARYYPGVGAADALTFKTFSGDGADEYSRLTITTAAGSSHPGTATVRVDNADLQVNGTVRLTGLLKPGSYTISTLPSASSSTGMVTVVSNPASGKRGDVLSDGTYWRYSDNTTV